MDSKIIVSGAVYASVELVGFLSVPISGGSCSSLHEIRRTSFLLHGRLLLVNSINIPMNSELKVRYLVGRGDVYQQWIRYLSLCPRKEDLVSWKISVL